MPWPHHEDRKPERPFKSFVDFIAHIGWLHGSRWFERHQGKYPCLNCGGRGWIYDPNDPPCPIEGNKMRDRIKCDKCSGSGLGTRKACAAAYSNAISDWKNRLTKWKERQSHRKSGIAKLTAKERAALGV